jgi:hypothetical protein
MIVHKGHNNFWPLLPILPFGKKSLTYQFKIGAEWFTDDLCEPEKYGLKLPAVGKFNYHHQGANWAIIHEGGKCFVYPRYYLDGLHELDHLKREIQPDVWYELTTEFDWLTFYFGHELIFTSEINIPTGWITPSYLGKRRVGVAKRNLKLEIR